MTRTLLLLAAVAFCWHCNRNTHTYDELPDRHLQFGTGGGFTGEVITYTLLENGQLFWERSLQQGEASALPAARKKAAGQLFEQASALACSEVLQPANRYAFFNRITAVDTCRWMWPADQGAPNPAIDSLFRQLLELTGP